MKNTFLAGFVAVLAAVSPVWADEAGISEAKLADKPTLNDLMDYAYAHSPAVAAAKAGWEAKVESVRLEGGAPDPEFMVEENGLSSPTYSAKLTFYAPFPGKLAAAGDVAEKEAEVARIALDRTVRDLYLAVYESAAEISYMEKALDVAAKNRELLDRLGAVSENAYAKDRAALIDLVRARGQAAQVAFDGELLKELLSAEKAKLNARLGRAGGAALGPVELGRVADLAYTRDEIENLAIANANEIKGATAEVGRARAAKKAADLESLPNFSFSVSKGPLDKWDASSYGVSAGFTIPFWFGKNAGRKASAAAKTREAEAGLEMRKTDLRTEVADLYFRTKNAERLVSLYSGTLLPQAKKSLDLAETWLTGGGAGFSEYVEVASTYYGFELALARAKADEAKYLARLSRYTDTDLTARRPSGGEGSK